MSVGPQAGALEGLKKRRDFLAANRGRRRVTPGFILLGRARGDGSDAMRFGLTASRRIGNAVTRNRARRRLREMARAVLPAHGLPGWDYVLIARRDATTTRPFRYMADELKAALAALHGGRS
ncbi:MAG: ribonuclease P protein component [Alphaproteobacteria bacterium]|nr:MAG: ribonuclease P protein component [Alphaproteobacteria bacterium]